MGGICCRSADLRNALMTNLVEQEGFNRLRLTIPVYGDP